MKIVQIAPFEERIPPEKYGGTELIVSNLTEELVRRGHKVFLIATGDSKTSAELIPVFEKSIRKEKISKNDKNRESLKYIGIGKTLEIINSLKKIDIIHNHIGWRLVPFLSPLKISSLTTLHGPLNPEYQKIVYKKYKDHPVVSISNSQRKNLPGLNYLSTVYNGININLFSFEKKRRKYLAFLGRTSPEKGLKEAVLIAKQSNIPLKIAAKIDAVDQEYFEKEINPLIDGKKIEYIGEIGPKEKSIFLSNAMALLAPIQWEEPFGLFMIEAMACGTPVIAFNRGSVPEIIQDKKTGFIVENISEAVNAIKKIDQIKREDCRKLVEEKFTLEIMTKKYEKIYEKIIKER